jgi:KUP system potassium uptake protein
MVSCSPALNELKRTSTTPLAPMALGALGVVFGDIGTSPLYAFSQCFTSRFPATPQNVLGILSLIIWALTVVVCVKYIAFLMRADYEGEGGILALLAQIAGKPTIEGMPVALSTVALVALFGAAALYGDGAITPAISVISAMEGLNVWTAAAKPFIVPGSIVLLAALFALQHRGTGRIGSLFGPVMLVWFGAIGIAGLIAVFQAPIVLEAVNPVWGIRYFLHNGVTSLVILGAIVLCVTGAEALYADLAHFGRKPITAAWYVSAFPSLLLNYLGQGAHTLAAPQSVANSFYALFPGPFLMPMVVVATAATVIASQSLITGVFSLTHQATQLGLAPRSTEVHTSRTEIGQVYLPFANVTLGIICITLVATFRSSAALGGAYGLAVSLTMLATTIAYARLTRVRFKWPLFYRVPVIALFLLFDVPFVLGNLSKFLEGAWLPLAIACVLFVFSVTWNRGRSKLVAFVQANSVSAEQFVAGDRAEPTQGIAIFFTPAPDGIPAALQNWWLREHLRSSTVVLTSFIDVPRPYVPKEERVRIERRSPHLLYVREYHGFMQDPKIDYVVSRIKALCTDINFDDPFYYLLAPEFVRESSRHAMPAWQRTLFVWMSRNSRSRTDSLGIPAARVVQFGVTVPI